MSALTEYLVAQASESRCRELALAARNGLPLTSDDCDVLDGMIARMFGSEFLRPNVSDLVGEALDEIEDAISVIESISTGRLERIVSQIEQAAT